MPGLTGLDVLAGLKTRRLDSKLIVLTMHHDADLATDAIRAGASGFLLKDSAGDELLVALRHALDGKVYITPAITNDVMERMAGAAKAKEQQLTARRRRADPRRCLLRTWKLTADELAAFELPGGDTIDLDARNKHRVFAFGPDVTLRVASKSKLFALVNIRYLWETGARLKTEGDTLVVTATFPVPSVRLK